MKYLLAMSLLLASGAHAADLATTTTPVSAIASLEPAALGKYVFDAARVGDTGLLRELLKRGARVDARDERGNTALILAAYHGHIETVDALLAAGADSNVGDGRGNTALMGALFKGDTVVADRLLEDPRIDVNLRNKAGQTAAMFAALFSRDALLDKLAAHGADFSVTDSQGLSAEQLASQQGNETLAGRIAELAHRRK